MLLMYVAEIFVCTLSRNEHSLRRFLPLEVTGASDSKTALNRQDALSIALQAGRPLALSRKESR
jgi:hypothetical protein